MSDGRVVIMICVDTLRADAAYAGITGESLAVDESVRAFFEAIGRMGAVFSNAISAAPYTSASHGAYFTGMWPQRNGLTEVFNSPLRASTIFDQAKARGTKTVFKTDFPRVLGPDLNFTKAVDKYIIEDDELLLSELHGGEETLAFWHLSGFHYPYGFHDLEKDYEECNAEVTRLHRLYGTPAEIYPDSIDESFRSGRAQQTLFKYKQIVQHLYAAGDYHSLIKLYTVGARRFIERRFTGLFERLLKIVANRRHLIVIFGDHGEQWDEQSYGHHNSMHEAVLRVPVVFLGSEVGCGLRFDSRVRTVDVCPTILEWLGYPVPIDIDGASLLSLIQGRAKGLQDSLPIAFAQAFNCEPQALVERQLSQLPRVASQGYIEHRLVREALYYGKYKLVRQWNKQFDVGISGLETCRATDLWELDGARSSWIPRNDLADVADSMGTLLNEYGRQQSSEPRSLPSDVLRFLSDFGYQR